MSNVRETVSILAIAMLLLNGCSDVVTGGTGGTSGTGGAGGSGGAGGTGGSMLCEGPEDCEDGSDCTNDACDMMSGSCSNDPVLDGTGCDFMGGDGACADGTCASCDLVPCEPDLVVTSLVSTGEPTVVTGNNVELPIRVVVKNQGAAGAGTFKVAANYSPGDLVVAFTVPGQSSSLYPFTSAELAAGAETVFEGKVTFISSARGQTVSLTATADSCSGDEFMPPYCRVEESDEMNNVSDPISVPLP